MELFGRDEGFLGFCIVVVCSGLAIKPSKSDMIRFIASSPTSCSPSITMFPILIQPPKYFANPMDQLWALKIQL
ncbi:hypothetical protein L218DRAFT_574786 [Marasmius fiardii PR-910]|nr:hypothetical protein L218DRAFT_574786 [Marasmius fiardii PR-910]